MTLFHHQVSYDNLHFFFSPQFALRLLLLLWGSSSSCAVHLHVCNIHIIYTCMCVHVYVHAHAYTHIFTLQYYLLPFCGHAPNLGTRGRCQSKVCDDEMVCLIIILGGIPHIAQCMANSCIIKFSVPDSTYISIWQVFILFSSYPATEATAR